MIDSQNPGARPNRVMYSPGLTSFCCHAASLSFAVTFALAFAAFSSSAAFAFPAMESTRCPNIWRPASASTGKASATRCAMFKGTVTTVPSDAVAVRGSPVFPACPTAVANASAGFAGGPVGFGFSAVAGAAGPSPMVVNIALLTAF